MKKLIIIALLGVSATMLLGSCKKFVDVNQNPNNATAASALSVFSGALTTSYRNQVGGTHIVASTWTGYNAHSTSFTGGGAEKTYAITNADFNAFSGFYDNLQDFQYIKDKAAGDGQSWLIPLAEVMQCMIYQYLVDFNGNVPYSESLQGAGKITPVYDDAKTIYENLVVRLDAAMVAINATTFPTDAAITIFDVLLQGSKANWLRFANTIKLRILMRQSFMPGRDTYISTNINNTIANGFVNANVLLNPGFQLVAGKLNPFYANYGFNELNNIVQNHQYRKMGAPIINWLKTSATTNLPPQAAGTPAATSSADTFRLQALAWPMGTTVTAISNTLSNYVGIPLGSGGGFATAVSSPMGPLQVTQGTASRAAMFMLLSESLFLQAEAKQRYPALVFAGGTAQQLYEAGILAHFRTCAAPSTAGTASNAGDAYAIRYYTRIVDAMNFPGYTGENINWTLSTDKIRAILIQKWVSLCLINGLEAWSEYRKSSGSASEGVPIKVKTVAVTSNPEPTRFLIPLSEVNVNGGNVPAGLTSFTKIFWDVN